jgi:hypothetical protein
LIDEDWFPTIGKLASLLDPEKNALWFSEELENLVEPWWIIEEHHIVLGDTLGLLEPRAEELIVIHTVLANDILILVRRIGKNDINGIISEVLSENIKNISV